MRASWRARGTLWCALRQCSIVQIAHAGCRDKQEAQRTGAQEHLLVNRELGKQARRLACHGAVAGEQLSDHCGGLVC